MLDRSRSRDRSKTGGAFSPAGLFANNEQGAWYDPSDFSTLYQNSTGTTPVTAVEQPVGLMLDRSRGLVLGPEFYAGGVSTGTAGYANYTAGTATWEIFRDAGGSGTLAIFSSAPAFTTYLVTLTMAARGADFRAVDCRIPSGTGGAGFSSIGGAAGNYSFIVRTGNSVSNITLTMPNIEFGGLFTNISVRELPGNHALQATSASRPVLRARYNQVLYSEAVTLANSWTTPFIANATRTDGALSIGGSEGYVYIARTNNAVTGTPNTVSFDAVCDQTITNVPFRASSGAGSASLLVNMVAGVSQRITIPAFTPGGTQAELGIDARDAIVPGGSNATGYTVTINRISILTAADQTSTGGAYQRIAAATDYDTSNPVWRPYLAFDGVDDSFGTSAIDFSGTDEMTVFAGLTKLSDAAVGLVAELSTNALSNPGFYLAAPLGTGAGGNFGFFSSGSVAPGTAAVSSTILAPSTRVVTGQSDISTDTMTLRVNGTETSNTSDQGTGNYGNYPLFIGRRNNTSFPFNGRLYSLAVLGRTATAPELSAMETYVAGKTGVNLP